MDQPEILLNTFAINKKRYRVLLTSDRIEWEPERAQREKTSLLLSDVLTVKGSPSPRSEKRTTGTPEKDQFLVIYFAKRVLSRGSNGNVLRKTALSLHHPDPSVVAHWTRSLTKLLDDQHRPRHVLMFINPFGGRQQGLNLYERFCKPLFQLAGIEVSCVISQRANQIRDIVMTQCLSTYDALCCVGGDGTFAELSNGLLYRTMKDCGLDALRPEFIPKPKLPIGVIPAGSTDTVAYSMHGTNDVRTAALHIILGQRRGLDMCSVCNGNGLIKFCASLLSYGYLGDVALDSENYRWMGPKRYEYAGVKKFITNQGYDGEVVFLDDADSTPTDDSSICRANCERCSNSPPTPDFHDADRKPSGKIFCHDDLVQLQQAQPQRGQKWTSVKGTFFMISGTNLTCSCARSPNGISKYSHLGDGYIDVIVVRHTSLLRNLQFVRNSLGSNGDIRKLPFVEIYRTRKFFFSLLRPEDEAASIAGSCQPISTPAEPNRTSQWNCDGEVILESNIFMSSHCQLIDVFMRGPHSGDADHVAAPSACCKGFC